MADPYDPSISYTEVYMCDGHSPMFPPDCTDNDAYRGPGWEISYWDCLNITYNNTTRVKTYNCTPVFVRVYWATLKYDVGEGSGGPSGDVEKCQPGQTVSMRIDSSSIPHRDGYDFSGWLNGFGFVYNYVNVPCGQTVTLRAEWTPILPDTTKPIITAPDETITLEQAKTWTPMHGVTAHDDKDGDITSKVVATPSVRPAAMTTTPGKYAFSYTVSDAAGNTATASRTVTVVRQSVLTYEPNNGTSELPRFYTRNEGETLKIEDGSHFTAPAGKRFDHWATHSDGSGTTYRPGQRSRLREIM